MTRILIVTHHYPAFLHSFYARHQELIGEGHAIHKAALDAAMFGETSFEVTALRQLGHEADDVVVNAQPLRAAWSAEHSVLFRSRLGVRLRRGFVPWPVRRPSWMWETLCAQAREYRPEVVHVDCMDVMPEHVARQLARMTGLLVGQIAAPLPSDRRYDAYGLVVSSIPALVDHFRQVGQVAEWLPLAFAPEVRQRIPDQERSVPVAFVGSVGAQFGNRVRVLEAVARRSPLGIWTADDLPTSLTPSARGAAFGVDMYRVLARSRIVVNDHGPWAGGAANNLRMYEATGMGALLVTNATDNLSDLFEPDREVVTYRSAQEAADKVSYYLANHDEAAAIASAGQARTLHDHTWTDRMARLIDFSARL